MTEKYTNSLIDSTRKYLNDLQFLGIQDETTIRDLSKYKLIHRLYVWANWMEEEEKVLKKIARLLECIIRSNSNIKLPTVVPGSYYTNANTSQTDYTWREIFSDPGVATHETIP